MPETLQLTPWPPSASSRPSKAPGPPQSDTIDQFGRLLSSPRLNRSSCAAIEGRIARRGACTFLSSQPANSLCQAFAACRGAEKLRGWLEELSCGGAIDDSNLSYCLRTLAQRRGLWLSCIHAERQGHSQAILPNGKESSRETSSVGYFGRRRFCVGRFERFCVRPVRSSWWRLL